VLNAKTSVVRSRARIHLHNAQIMKSVHSNAKKPQIPKQDDTAQ